MQKYILFFLTFTLSASAFGQTNFRQNDIYLEFLGNGIYASLNYERQLTTKPGLGVRAGVGYFSGNQQFRVSIPVGINYLFVLNNNSFIDAGLGATWSGAAGLKREGLTGERDYRERIWSFVPSLGYRHHTTGNLMWRASFTPIFNKYRTLPYVGISVGKRF